MPISVRRKSELFMVAAALLWSTSGVLIKLIPWNALVIAGGRSFLGGLVVFFFMRATGAKIRFNRYSVSSGLLLGMLMLFFVVSNKLTTAANAIVLEYTSPVFLMIFSAVFLKQKFHAADYIVVAAVFFGISLFFFDHLTPGHLAGNCLSILNGVVCAAGYLVSWKADGDSRLSGILFSHVIAAGVGLSFASAFPPRFTATATLSILALGIFQVGFSYVFYALALNGCPPLACSLIGALEPLMNPVLVFLATGEAPGAFALLGGAVVLASVTGWCVQRDRALARSAKRTEN